MAKGISQNRFAKKLMSLLLVGLLSLSLISCSQENKNNNSATPTAQNQENKTSENNAIKALSLEKKDDKTIAIIKNSPDEETLKKVSKLESYKFDESTETMVIVPVYNNSTIEVKNLVFDNGDLKEADSVYKAEKTEDGYGLFVQAVRPEGAPLLKIIVKNEKGQGEYLISYNGKDGTPDIEYISVQ